MATAQATSATSPRPPRSPVGIIFLTIFLDLAGFSIVFPLFPAMLKFYFHEAQAGGLFAHFVDLAHRMVPSATEDQVAALFGGLLGSLYSTLQFFSTSFWGRLSDRLGRRTVLLGTIAGTALSYLLWIFAQQFWLLVLARGLGGIMAGNISVCTAAMADVTSTQKRSRGMILVGVAFGLGFVLGPALGGTLAAFDLTQSFPNSVAYGLNPFSACALASFLICVINYFWVLFRFPETLPVEKRASLIKEARNLPTTAERLHAIFQSNVTAIRRANLVNLYYTIAFSGLEFTLTFLAVERFNYTPEDNRKIFIFMGVMLLLVQGWLGRKYVPRWGEKPSAIIGMACGVVGFLILAYSAGLGVFYIGLAVFSISIGLTSVCLPALVSLYSDASAQGRHIGSARAAQALGRAIGPLLAAIIYYRAGATLTYIAGAAALLIPVWLAMKLPAPNKSA